MCNKNNWSDLQPELKWSSTKNPLSNRLENFLCYDSGFHFREGDRVPGRQRQSSSNDDKGRGWGSEIRTERGGGIGHFECIFELVNHFVLFATVVITLLIVNRILLILKFYVFYYKYIYTHRHTRLSYYTSIRLITIMLLIIINF